MKTISNNSKLQDQTRLGFRPFLEVKEDIHLDPVLNLTCGTDVSKFCSEQSLEETEFMSV